MELLPFLIGLISGVVPLVLGFKKKKIFLGVLALITSIVVGTAMSLIYSTLLVIVFVVLILMEQKEETPEKEPEKEDEK